MTELTTPADMDAEESVLGCLLLTNRAFPEVADVVGSDDFHKPSHRAIFDAMVNLYSRGEVIDVHTVTDVLNKNGENPHAQQVPHLQIAAGLTTNVVSHAHIVRRYSQLRNLIQLGQDISALGYKTGADPNVLIDQAAQMVHDLSSDRAAHNGSRRLGDTLEEWQARVEERGEQGIAGLSTGFTDLDNYLAGMRPGQLLTVAARPGVGKSMFAGALAMNVAFDGHPTLFVSVEMSMAELQDRLMAQRSLVWLDSLRQGKLTPKDWESVQKWKPVVTDYPIWIYDNPAATLLNIRSEARKVAHRAGGLDFLVVDYLQLVSSVGRQENRQVEVANLSRGLKKLAGELEVPVVALSQLNRNLELRAEKQPQLSDLRESGAIENDSDVVMFLYRDEFHNPKSDRKGMCDVVISKQRNGPTGTVTLSYEARTGRFGDLSMRREEVTV